MINTKKTIAERCTSPQSSSEFIKKSSGYLPTQFNKEPKPIRIGVVVGEDSGDLLGASLVKALKSLCPDLFIEGIIGPRMEAEGCHKLYSIERLSVMGIVEPLKRLPEILKIRRAVYQHFIQNPPDVFIGIDAPDFNLSLEERLRRKQIKTIHYVSPSVWAWRRRRVHKIKRAVDLMLATLPFEESFYRDYDVPVKFVGHPIADEIPISVDSLAARQKLGLDAQKKVLAILPGSRAMEIKRLAEPFILTAKWCLAHYPELEVITAMVNEAREQQFRSIWKQVAPEIPVKIYREQSRDVMAASDAILLASGTATLEAMLFKKPMVVAYRLSSLTYAIAKHLVTGIRYFSLPNLIAGKSIVPEFLQSDVIPSEMGKVLLNYLTDDESASILKAQFLALHSLLKKNASIEAAKAILAMLQ